MASLSLVFDILARDKASKEFNNIGDAADRAGKKGTAFGSAVGKGLAVAGAALAGAGLVAGLKGFYDAAAESAKIGRLTAQVIKSTGGAAKISAAQVGDLATAISNKTGADDEAIQSAENLLLTFTGVRNEVGKGNDIFNQATSTIVDMSAALGQDTSASAIQLGKALNDPIKGVSALSKVGVSFTQQQKDQIKTLVKSGDTLSAQKIILAELGKEFGGAAEAASTPLDKLKVNLGNLQEQIGSYLIPVVDKVAGFLVTKLVPGLAAVGGYLSQKLGPALGTVKDAVGQFYDILFKGDFTHGPLAEDSPIVDRLFAARDALKEIGGVAKQAFDVIFRGDFTHGPLSEDSKFVDVLFRVREGLAAVGDFVRTNLAPAFKAYAEFIQGTFLPALARVGAFLVSTFTPAFNALVDLYKNSIGPALKDLAERVKANLPALQDLGKFVGTVALVIGGLAAKIVGQVLPVLLKLAGFLAVNLIGSIGVVISIIAGLVDAVERLWHAAQDAAGFIAAAFVTIQNAVSTAWETVIRPTFRFIAEAFLAVVGAIINGAADAFGWVPGIGGKLKDAATHFNTFRDDVNASLDGLKDKTVSVTAVTKITDANAAVQASNSKEFHAAGGIVGRAMGGMLRGPGSGTSDSILGMDRATGAATAWVSNGEYVVNAKSTQKYLPMIEAINAGKLAAGGGVGLNATANSGPLTSGISSFYANTVAGLTARAQEQANKAAAAASVSAGTYSGALPTGPAVTRWAPLVLQVLSELGLSGSLVGKVLAQIKTESGGNPNATQGNIGDVNNKSGDLARGLMQVIGATFRAYAGPYRSLGQYDPHASIYAGLNYAMHRYGPNLSALGQGHGYALGGQVLGSYATGTDWVPRTGVYQLHKGEAVTPAAQNTRGGGAAVFHLYDANNVLLGTIDGRIDAADAEHATAMNHS